MNEAAAKYSIGDAKQVFPGLADGVLQKHRDRGLLSYSKVKRGSTYEARYDLYEVVHLNVIHQLSILGVLRGDLNRLTVFVEPLETDYRLTEPEPIISAYAFLGAGCVLSVWLNERPVEGANSRNRRSESDFIMRLHADPVRDALTLTTLDEGHRFCFTSITIRIGMMLMRCHEVLGTR